MMNFSAVNVSFVPHDAEYFYFGVSKKTGGFFQQKVRDGISFLQYL